MSGNATDRSVKDCESTVNKVVRIFRNPYFLDAETYLWVRNVYTGFGMSSLSEHTLVLDGFLNGLVIDDSIFNQLAGIDAIVLIDATELHAGAFNNAQGRGIFISGFVNTSHFAHKRFRNNMLACFNMCRHDASPSSMSYRKAYKGFRLLPIRYSIKVHAKSYDGQMGGDRVTTQNLRVLKVIPEQNLLIVKGSFAGCNGSTVLIEK